MYGVPVKRRNYRLLSRQETKNSICLTTKASLMDNGLGPQDPSTARSFRRSYAEVERPSGPASSWPHVPAPLRPGRTRMPAKVLARHASPGPVSSSRSPHPRGPQRERDEATSDSPTDPPTLRWLTRGPRIVGRTPPVAAWPVGVGDTHAALRFHTI